MPVYWKSALTFAASATELPGCPEQPPCYVTSDATIEAIGELLADNPRGLLLARDERCRCGPPESVPASRGRPEHE